MIAHTPTIFASVALVAIIMAVCVIAVGRLRTQDGLFNVGCAVSAHACAYVCYALYGHVSLWISYALANSLLSLAMAFYCASIFRIRELKLPRVACFIWPLVMAVAVTALIDTTKPRMLVASIILGVQCMLMLVWSLRTAEKGERAYLLLVIGSSVSLLSLLIRMVAIVSGGDIDMRYDISNLKQTISVSSGTATVMMLSIGLILLAKERSELATLRLAMHDALTGALNRRAILLQLDEELERARRSSANFALVMLDIDHFKKINDGYGHLAGDQVLVEFTQRIVSRLRQYDRLGRYGGEEFLLLLPNANPAGAEKLVNALRASFNDKAIALPSEPLHVSLSAGIWCGQPDENDTADSLIAKADQALYQAKAQGRNRVVVCQMDSPCRAELSTA